MKSDIMIRDIKGYEGAYTISSDGIVFSKDRCTDSRWGTERRLKGKQLKTVKNKHGYVKVILSHKNKSKTFLVHRLVAQAFIPNPENKPQVNHINGVKDDNRLENLEWTTVSENVIHAYKIGLKTQVGEKNNGSILTEKEVLEIRELYKSGKFSHSELAKKFNCGRTTISYIVRRKLWNHI